MSASLNRMETDTEETTWVSKVLKGWIIVAGAVCILIAILWTFQSPQTRVAVSRPVPNNPRSSAPIAAPQPATLFRQVQNYPSYKTKPFEMAPHDTQFYLRMFQTIGAMVRIKERGQSVIVSSLYLLGNDDTSDFTVCGGSILGKQDKMNLFVITHGETYSSVSKEGWAKMGCQTKGGTQINWVPRNDGTGGSDLRAFTLGVAAKPRPIIVANPPPPAVHPSSLPFGVRQRIAAEFEDSLSQTLGADVTLTSDHEYKEQDGSSTSCITGSVKGERFRMVEPHGKDLKINPTEVQWIEAGCTRPDYQLIR
jgi:hypothetical protein